MKSRHTLALGSSLAACLLLVAGAGCHPCRQQCSFPKGAIPAPVGTYACQWQQAHAAAAHADGFVLCLADWVGDSTQFGPAAKKRLIEFAEQGGTPAHQVLIQESEDAELNDQRRSAVIEFLAARGSDFPAEQVVLGEPKSLGLYDSSRVLSSAGSTAGGGLPRAQPMLLNPF